MKFFVVILSSTAACVCLAGSILAESHGLTVLNAALVGLNIGNILMALSRND